MRTGQSDRPGLRRLAWAGVEVRLGGTHLLIDALERVDALAGIMGAPRAPMPDVEVVPGTHALISHVHPDHYDPAVLRRVVRHGGTVGCHGAVQGEVSADLSPIPQRLHESRGIGPLTVTPVPSMDWRGDDQVAWVVEGGGTRILHAGDTMWHGCWWSIGERYGPFDIAFLPVNGVVARFEQYQAEVPVTLTPEHAVEAAIALDARKICPIHYGLFDNPPSYVEQPDIETRLLAAAERRGIDLVMADVLQEVPV